MAGVGRRRDGRRQRVDDRLPADVAAMPRSSQSPREVRGPLDGRSHATSTERSLGDVRQGRQVVDSRSRSRAPSTTAACSTTSAGKPVVHTLAATVPAAANARHYAQIVRDTATYRGLIRAGTDIASLGFEHIGEPQELVDRAEQIVFSIGDQRISSDFERIDGLLKQSFERLDEIQNSDHDITGAPSGFKALDELTAGFQKSNLVVLAARPGMGKTSLALNIATHLAVREQIPVAIFSLEMSREEVTTRLMCTEGRVDSKRLRVGKLSKADWNNLTNASTRLYNAPIFVDDSAGVSPIEIKAKARRLKARLDGHLGLVVVDYLQLMGGQTRVENRVQEISQISRALKLIARDLDVPVLAISQLSRAVEQRTDKRPVLSDLRESGSIEQDADLVMFVYRDDYYDDSSDDKGTAELILAKHRNGPIDKIRLAYIGRYTKFDNLARGVEQQV